MKKLRTKLHSQGGFTLIEMLIVVAIIAILVAVSIPLINNALERAKHATDAANERSAKAEILIQYLSDGGGKTVSPGTEYYYDAVKGSLEDDKPDKDYGKHKGHGVIKVSVDAEGVVTVKWTTSSTDTTDLCSGKDVGH